MLTTHSFPERSLYRAVHAPYYIYALDYLQQSAGIRALHYLCHALNELGYEAYVTCEVTHPPLHTPRLTNRVRKQHAAAGRTPIVVYPEVIPGNPLNGEIVVRWLLNQPGHLSGDKYFDDRDILFTFDRSFLPPGMKAEVLTFPLADRSIFNNDDNPHDEDRQLVCYYANKYLAKGGQLTHHVQGAVSLCQDVKLTHRQLSEILRQSRLLYIYEPTALMTEAQLCGCPVVVIVTEYWKNNINNPHFADGMGVVMDDSPASVEEARRRARARAENYDKSIQIGWENIARFADFTQNETANRIAERLAASSQLLPPDEIYGVEEPSDSAYASWRSTHLQANAILSRCTEASGDTQQPVFLILIPLSDWHQSRLEATLDSLAAQQGASWQVIIVATHEPPVDFVPRENVRWISDVSQSFIPVFNRAVDETGYDWLCILEAGDTLEPYALALLAAKSVLHPEWRLIYGDEDSLMPEGGYERPYFKPDFDIDLLRSAPYSLGGGFAMQRALLQELGGFREAYEGVEFYDLFLRAYELIGGTAFGHIQDVLYHRHPEGGHQLKNDEEIITLRKACLAEHFERVGQAAVLEAGVLPGTFRIRYLLDESHKVSIIVPTLNGGAYLQRCLGAIVENTKYKNIELIVVDQGSDDAETCGFLDYLKGMQDEAIRVLFLSKPTSLPASINAGAKLAQGKYLLFLSDAAAPLNHDWLDEMLGYAIQPGIGVVGTKMIGPDGNISFAGYILGMDGRPAGLHDLHEASDSLGYFGRLQVPSNHAAVSASCMLTSRSLFEMLAGLDEDHLAGGYSDIDYCLRASEKGFRTILTPFALVLHEHTTKPPAVVVDDCCDGDAVEPQAKKRALLNENQKIMFDRWLHVISHDPFYNNNLTLSGRPFDIETSPFLTEDPDFHMLPRMLAHPGDQSGCGEYRVTSPLRALVNAGMVQGWDTMEHLSIPELGRMSPDTIILQRQITPFQINVMEEYKRYSKALLVYELDDLITNIQVANRQRINYPSRDLTKRFRSALNVCDRLVVSTDYLKEQYSSFKSDIRVVPNYIERAVWGGLSPKRRHGLKPRVGWAGSISHDGDLAIIRDVVLATKDIVDWVFMGSCPDGVRQFVEYRGAVDIDHYPMVLASLNLDLAIAPLEDVPFNHAKSHLKLLEYGVLGYPVICTDITPYQGNYPVTRVRNRFKEWVDAIHEHVSDMDTLAKRGDELRDHINANWILEDHLDVWLKAWLP